MQHRSVQHRSVQDRSVQDHSVQCAGQVNSKSLFAMKLPYRLMWGTAVSGYRQHAISPAHARPIAPDQSPLANRLRPIAPAASHLEAILRLC